MTSDGARCVYTAEQGAIDTGCARGAGAAAVCSQHHWIDQQLCRWLLLSLDRLPGNTSTMTRELVANMLGVGREGITESASRLHDLGVIEYKRRRITAVDRSKLEATRRECYAVVKAETDRRLPYGVSPLPSPRCLRGEAIRSARSFPFRSGGA